MTGASASSDFEGEPVMRREIAARFDLGELVEHLRAHMREHDAPGAEAGAVGIDLLEAEMGDRSAREPVAFGDEEVRPLRCLDERLGPARVAGIDEGAGAVGEPHGGRGRARGVDHLGRADAKVGMDVVLADRQIEDVQREFPRVPDEPGKNTSIAAVTRSPVPTGPMTVSGLSRWLSNWASRKRNGRPPKWSPWRCDSITASMRLRSIPSRFSATSEVAPKSSAIAAAAVSMKKHVFARPPDPNASPQPTTVRRMASRPRAWAS